MPHYLAVIFVFLLELQISASAAQPCLDKRLALTFDDAPTANTVVLDGTQRTQLIIKALKDANVEQAAFFAVSQRLDESGEQRLVAYAEAGHIIANHSHTHANLHRVSADAFLQDVQTAHLVLSEYVTFKPLFRFPYLNEGVDVETRDQVRLGLIELGYQQGYVTIDNFDFYLDRLLRDAAADGLQIDHHKVSDFYVDLILGAAKHYQRIACRWLDESPAHVLLLHENDLAALYLGNLITALNQSGWTIIPVSEAYQDPIAQTVPDTLLLGQGRVAAIAHLAGAPAESLRHQGEDTDYLRQRFEQLLVKTKIQD